MGDINDLLGGGSASIKWDEIGQGTVIKGPIIATKTEQCSVYQQPGVPDFWPNGDPKMQAVITWQTELRDPNKDDDDGVRILYTGPYRNDGSILGEMRKTLQRKKIDAIEPGGMLATVWATGVGKSGDPRQFQVDYESPASDVNGLINDAAATAAAPAAAPTQPAAQPASALL